MSFHPSHQFSSFSSNQLPKCLPGYIHNSPYISASTCPPMLSILLSFLPVFILPLSLFLPVLYPSYLSLFSIPVLCPCALSLILSVFILPHPSSYLSSISALYPCSRSLFSIPVFYPCPLILFSVPVPYPCHLSLCSIPLLTCPLSLSSIPVLYPCSPFLFPIPVLYPCALSLFLPVSSCFYPPQLHRYCSTTTVSLYYSPRDRGLHLHTASLHPPLVLVSCS